MKRFLTPRGILYLLVVLFIGWMLTGYISALVLTYPNAQKIEPKDSIAGFHIDSIALASSDGTKLSAWLVPNRSDSAVIILAGIRGNRTSNIERAKLYLEKGFTVLLPDLRGTGASGGDVISFGWNERKDLEACYSLLKSKGYGSISVHGISLGAATIAYSFNDNVKYDLVVLESCYDNIDHAFVNRVNGRIPSYALWPVYLFTEWRIGAKASQLDAERCLKKCSSPVLYFCGDSEKQIKQEEMQNVFNAIGSKDKVLYVFKGAEHEDFMKRYRDEYIKMLYQFLDKHEEAR